MIFCFASSLLGTISHNATNISDCNGHDILVSSFSKLPEESLVVSCNTRMLHAVSKGKYSFIFVVVVCVRVDACVL